MNNFIKTLAITLSENYNMLEFKHCYRINGIVDIYKYGNNVFVKPENKHYKILEEDLQEFVINIIEKFPEQEMFAKTKTNTMSYKEFKDKQRRESIFNTPQKMTAEMFHWNNNKDKKEGDNLYFLFHNNHVKIGRSKDVNKRIKSLSTALSSEYKVYVFEQKGFLEKKFHQCFIELRSNREWFKNDIRFDNFLTSLKKEWKTLE